MTDWLLKGLKGYLKEAMMWGAVGVVAASGFLLLVGFLGSFGMLLAYYGGSYGVTPATTFPDWLLVSAHIVVAVTFFMVLRPWRLPKALKAKAKAEAEAEDRKKLVKEARQRLAERGAYTNPARNHR